MRLTNYHRDAFVKSIMDDVPQHDFQKDFESVVQKELEKILPKDILKIWKDNSLKGYLQTARLHRVDPLYFSVPLSYEEGLSLVSRPAVKKIIEAARDEKRKREELKLKVKSAIYSVSTVKKAKELIPELAKYLPDEKDKHSKFAPAAIVNLSSDLTEAGWPKKFNN
jgi:hypothetical protein